MAEFNPARYGEVITDEVQPVAPIAPDISAERYGEVITDAGQLTPEQAEFYKPTGLEGYGRGVADITQGLEQLYYMAKDPQKAAEFTSQKTEEMQRYEKLRGPDAGFDWWRMSGAGVTGSAPMVFGAPATIGGRIVAGAAEGGALAGSMFTPEGESKVAQTMIGAGVGGAAPLAMQALGRLGSSAYEGLSDFYRATGRTIDGFFNPQQITVKIDNALAQKGVDVAELSEAAQANLSKHINESLKATGKIDVDAALRKTEIEEMGFKGPTGPTTAQITRDPIQWQREHALGELKDIEGAAELRLKQPAQKMKLRERGEEISRGMGEAAGAEERAFGAIEQRWVKTQDDVGKLYSEATKAAGADDLFPVDDFIAKVDPVLDEGEDYIPSKLYGKIQGIISGEETPTVREMVNIRKRIGTMAKSTDGSVRYVGGQLSRAVDDAGDMAEGEASTALKAYSKARQGARERFKEFDIGAKRTTPLKQIAEGKIVSQDFIQENIVRGKWQDVAKLKKTMLKEDPLAWDDVKSDVILDMMTKATAKGEDKYSHHAFRSAWDGIHAKTKGQIFTPKEIKLVDNFKRVSEWLTAAPEGAIRGSQTAPILLELLNAVDSTPLLGPGLALVVRPARASMKEAFDKKQITAAMAGKIEDGLAKVQAIRDRGDMWATKLTPSAPAAAAIGVERALSE